MSRTARALVREEFGRGASSKSLARFHRCSTQTIQRTIDNVFKDDINEDFQYTSGTAEDSQVVLLDVSDNEYGEEFETQKVRSIAMLYKYVSHNAAYVTY